MGCREVYDFDTTSVRVRFGNGARYLLRWTNEGVRPGWAWEELINLREPDGAPSRPIILNVCNMKFLSLQPFVPSGESFEKSRELFVELGFNLLWDMGGMAGFERDGCGFLLQDFNNPGFAENFMVSVGVDDVEAFRQMVLEKGLPEKYGIKVSTAKQQPYGKEVNVIDIAGVCWHFIQR